MPLSDVPLSDVKTKHTVKVNIDEPIEMESITDEPIETGQVSKLNGHSEAVVVSGHPKSSDHITVVKKDK